MDNIFDQQFRQHGISLLCGIDEAGRGALAGPVVAAAVILPANLDLPGIEDSKKLNPKQRITAAEIIREQALALGIGKAEVQEIDRINILQATFLAMQRAVNELTIKPDYCLIDGRDFPLIFFGQEKEPLRGRAVIKGDGLSQSVAAASIIAKTYRDYLMIKLDPQHTEYGFADHKGYGTVAHRENLLKFGPSVAHRRAFLRKLIAAAEVNQEWINV